MQIIIHSKSGCPYCVLAKQYLGDQNIAYDEVIHNDVDERNALYDLFGLTGSQRTVPQIFAEQPDGTMKRIGGYSDLVASDVAARALTRFDEDF